MYNLHRSAYVKTLFFSNQNAQSAGRVLLNTRGIYHDLERQIWSSSF